MRCVRGAQLLWPGLQNGRLQAQRQVVFSVCCFVVGKAVCSVMSQPFPGCLPALQGADVVEGQKTYARIFRALSNVGIRI